MKIICDWNNCDKLGEYKAPIEKDNSKNYRLLCYEHIKEFNKNWNYFANMTDQQVNEFIKSDMTWHKPTQNFSAQDNFFKILWNNTLKENLDEIKDPNKAEQIKRFTYSDDDIKAFNILSLKIGVDWSKIRDKFKKLVKKFHPDKNSGNKKYEEKLKIITLAYTQLRRSYRR
ncbi:J domain-containing protein [Candidatus Pelagibacter communis]|uniref:J domain-containing protein n=1 Tax=Pelagibacter ubique TaxID=198252 RepID=UPI00094CDF18|nr:DnaJ domain-containing protein [Candidatus Pelagibacter ubique]